VIDDERLQELLSKASSLYNTGEYQGAIAAWQEVLTLDPDSRKAMEGIRMATLLLGEWEPRAAGAPPEGAASQPADGAPGGEPQVPPEEMEATVDLGIARVRQLLAERKYEEAIEGAQALLPMTGRTEEIQRLIDEAQQAFESAPFVEEHLTLARELLDQERFAEAEVECRKIFVLDREHPLGRALLKQIRDRVQGSLRRAASQLGGMTIKLSMPEIREAGAQPASGGTASTDEPSAAGEPLVAGGPEEAATRTPLEEAFDAAGVVSGTEEILPTEPPTGPSGASIEAPAAPPEPTVVEAKTIVPPSMRMQPSKPAEGRAEAPAPAAPVVDFKGTDDPTAWETELTQLNLKEGERGLLRGTKAKAGAIPVDPGDGVDLMSLLDNDVGGPQEKAGTGSPAASQAPGAPGSPSVAAASAPHSRSASPAHRTEVIRPREAPRARAVANESPASVARMRGAERPPVPSPTTAGSGPSFLKVAVLLLLLVAGGGAAWWYFFKPQSLSGAWLPGQLATPPAGSPADPATAAAQGPILTPIGGSGSPQAQEGLDRDEASVVQAPPAIEVDEDSAGLPVAAGPPAPQQARPSPVPTGPIKPAGTAQVSPEEARRKVAAYTADGQRLMKLGKWREARAKFNAVLALDPVNFDAKELADQVQAKIDDEQRLQDDFDSMKQLVEEKDYENALRKLYRLPRDRGLGDVDLYTRNAWFNWAVVLMRAGNAPDALQKLSEVLAIDPDDAEALKLQEVAERYSTRAKDRVYQAFVAGLKLRAYNQKY
jgi:tetratricopeptide (TPR) repeat protein